MDRMNLNSIKNCAVFEPKLVPKRRTSSLPSGAHRREPSHFSHVRTAHFQTVSSEIFGRGGLRWSEKIVPLVSFFGRGALLSVSPLHVYLVLSFGRDVPCLKSLI